MGVIIDNRFTKPSVEELEKELSKKTSEIVRLTNEISRSEKLIDKLSSDNSKMANELSELNDWMRTHYIEIFVNAAGSLSLSFNRPGTKTRMVVATKRKGEEVEIYPEYDRLGSVEKINIDSIISILDSTNRKSPIPYDNKESLGKLFYMGLLNDYYYDLVERVNTRLVIIHKVYVDESGVKVDSNLYKSYDGIPSYEKSLNKKEMENVIKPFFEDKDKHI